MLMRDDTFVPPAISASRTISAAKRSSCCFVVKTGKRLTASATTSIRHRMPMATSM